jgi:hypothetical protein
LGEDGRYDPIIDLDDVEQDLVPDLPLLKDLICRRALPREPRAPAEQRRKKTNKNDGKLHVDRAASTATLKPSMSCHQSKAGADPGAQPE